MLRGSAVTAALLACVCVARAIYLNPVEGLAGITDKPTATLQGEDSGVSKLVPFPSTIVEARGTALQIKVRNIDTLEDYAFKAHNGRGQPASWSVMVQAYMPESTWLENQYLPPDSEVAVTSREQLDMATTATSENTMMVTSHDQQDETTTASPESEVVVTSREQQDETTTATPESEVTSREDQAESTTDTPKTEVPMNTTTCSLPMDRGPCRNYSVYWRYDMEYGGCSRFWYGGCEGNGNRFSSKEECEEICVQPPPRDFCFLKKDPGPCTKMETRWAYESRQGACAAFEYGGCGGNRNNFPSQEYCQYYCDNTQDICQLPMRAGRCDASLMRWFYDPVSDSCSQFTYGGCDGNGNQFSSKEECEDVCVQLSSTVATLPLKSFPTPNSQTRRYG